MWSERNITISFIKQACTAICFYEYQVVVDPKGDGNGGGINSGNAGTRVPKPTNFNEQPFQCLTHQQIVKPLLCPAFTPQNL